MKKTWIVCTFLLIVGVVMGQDPVITFNKTTHDFGKINETDGKVTTIFEIKNEGMSPLVLNNVKASCGCTTPQWTHEPIEPGQSGKITVTYNPSGRPGKFQKTITITSNATEPTTKLYIKGEVIPKPAKPANEYPVKMCELSLKQRTLNFGTVIKGNKKTLEIEYTNLTDNTIIVDILSKEENTHFIPNVTLKTIAPNETGKIQVTLNSQDSPLFGPIEAKMYVVVNGKRNISDVYAISINANIKENFSTLSVTDRQQAPIIEVQRTIDLGVLQQGKKYFSKFTIGNVGVNQLYVRRIFANDPAINIQAPKSSIKGGKKTEIKFEIDATDMQPTKQYVRIITLISNDPNASVINIKVNWTVE